MAKRSFLGFIGLLTVTSWGVGGGLCQVSLSSSGGGGSMNFFKINNNNEFSIPPLEDMKQVLDWLGGNAKVVGENAPNTLDTSVADFRRQQRFTDFGKESIWQKIEQFKD